MEGLNNQKIHEVDHTNRTKLHNNCLWYDAKLMKHVYIVSF